MYFPDLKSTIFIVSCGQQTQWEHALLKQWVSGLPHQLLHSAHHVPTDLAESG